MTTLADEFGTDSPPEDMRAEMRREALASTYYFATLVCGFADLDPRLHGAMCAWIQRTERPDPDRDGHTLPSRLKLGMAPRGHLKSSCWTIANTLRLTTADTNLRVLISNETDDNVVKFLSAMQQIVLSPMYRWLFPECVPDDNAQSKWNQHQLELKRTALWPQATIEGIAVGGASTSNHYNLICNDDPVGKRARMEPTTMQKAIDHRKLCWSLLIDPSKDRIFDVGTRWATSDYIDWVLRNVRNVDIFKLSLYRPDNTVIWPDRFPPDVVESIQAEQGVELFELQYMNEPLAQGATDFDPARLRAFRWGYKTDQNGVEQRYVILERAPHEGGERWVRVRDLSIVQITDAGISPDSGDARTANIVVGLAPGEPGKGFDIVLLKADAKKLNPRECIFRSKEVYDEWQPMTWGIEVFGAHEVYFYWIVSEFPKARIRKLKTDTTKSKEARIREFYPYIDQGRFYLHPREAHEFVKEYSAFPNGRTVDLLDALAYVPEIWAPPAQVRIAETPEQEMARWVEEAKEASRAKWRDQQDGRCPVTRY